MARVDRDLKKLQAEVAALEEQRSKLLADLEKRPPEAANAPPNVQAIRQPTSPIPPAAGRIFCVPCKPRWTSRNGEPNAESGVVSRESGGDCGRRYVCGARRLIVTQPKTGSFGGAVRTIDVVDRHGTTRRPVVAPLGWVVVCFDSADEVTIRILDADDQPLVETARSAHTW